jgi:hypothetical protein
MSGCVDESIIPVVIGTKILPLYSCNLLPLSHYTQLMLPDLISQGICQSIQSPGERLSVEYRDQPPQGSSRTAFAGYLLPILWLPT